METSFWESFLQFPWDQLGLFCLLIILSFLVSGSEIAYLTLTPSELEELKEDEAESSKRILKMVSTRDNRNRLLASILIANNFVNVAAILVASSVLIYMSRNLHLNAQLVAVISVILITGALLLFGEIIPKGYARENRVKFARVLSRPLWIIRWILYIPSLMLAGGTDFISRRIENLSQENASAEDLKHAIDLTMTGLDSEEETAFLKGIVNFVNTPVKSIMRARVDVKAVEINTPLPELIEEINEHKFSRLPVYEESLDNIKGILHIKALLPILNKKVNNFNLESLLREAYFVPENKKIDDLLEELKSKRLHLAVVVDEFGGTAGIVTLEDIIEEIFGDIMDESDTVDIIYRKIDDNEYVFEGKTALNDVKRILNLEHEIFEDVKGDSESLGGLILELHGKIPKEGDIVKFNNFEMHIEAASKSRIIRVKVVIHSVNHDDELMSES